MKSRAVVIGIYGALVLAGGLTGYFIAGSLASLISGGLSGLALIICSHFIWRNSVVAYNITVGLLCVLLAVFCYRFMSTSQIVPSGVLALLNVLVLIYVGRQKPAHIPT